MADCVTERQEDFYSIEAIRAFQERLMQADGILEVQNVIRERYPQRVITDDHMRFLTNLGGAAKLREAYYEVLNFDDKLNSLLLEKSKGSEAPTKWVKTSQFIPEEDLALAAIDSPDKFADAEQAQHAVKHRSSLTRSIVDGFRSAERYLRDRGIQPQQASMFDLGCGTGKAVMISKLPQYDFQFKKSTGVELFEPFRERAEINARLAGLNVDGINGKEADVKFVFADAAQFHDFNGVNVIYMYNPFDKDVMERVEQNLRRYAGKSVVIYNKPMNAETFDRNGWARVDSSGDPNVPDNDTTTILFARGFEEDIPQQGPVAA